MSAAETPGSAPTRVVASRGTVPAASGSSTSPPSASWPLPRPVVRADDGDASSEPSSPDDAQDLLRGRRVLIVDRATDDPAEDGFKARATRHLADRAAEITLLTTPGDVTGRGPLRASVCDLFDALAVRLAVQPLQADLVVTFVPPGPGGSGGADAAARWSRRHGIPLVTIVHGQEPKRSPRRRGQRVGGRGGGRSLTMDGEVAITDEALLPVALAAGADPAHLHLLPGPNEVRGAGCSRRRARAELGWPAHRFTVVHAGPMGHRQDLATLVEAVRLLDDVGDLAVVLVGDGPQRVALERQSFGIDAVEFGPPPGSVPTPAPDRPGLFLAAADVLVVADPGTGAPADRGQLERYLGAGRPVLAAVPESSVVAHALRRTGGAGLRVNPRDPVGLAEALLRLRDSPQQRSVMSRAARRYARSQLGPAAALRRLDLVVAAALGERSGRITAPADRTVEPQACRTAAHAGRDC